MINRNGISLSGIYHGSDAISAVYHGADLVWKQQKVVLPVEYQLCKYLESSGGQYIVFDNKAIYTFRMTTDLMWIDNGSGEQSLGLTNYTGGVELWFATPNKLRLWSGPDGNGDVVLLSPNEWVNAVFSFSAAENFRKISINGIETMLGTFTNHIYANRMELFGYTGTRYPWSGKLKHTRIECDSCEYSLFPAVRISDNKPGMYDMISNKFFVNSGTGEFGYELMDSTYAAPI